MQDAILRTVFQFLTVLFFVFGVASFFGAFFAFCHVMGAYEVGELPSTSSKILFAFLIFIFALFILAWVFLSNLYLSYEPFQMFFDFCWNGGAWVG